MTYKEFITRVFADKEFFDEESTDYATYHGRRLYTTYLFCEKYLKKGDHVLSIGLGHGTIEKFLIENIGVTVTAVDFPGTFEKHGRYFSHLGIKMVETDGSEDIKGVPMNHFDMVLYSEIIEHIPVPPTVQLTGLVPFLNKNGKIVITTPNLGSAMTIAKLLVMRPLLPPAERTFGPVCFENQGIHRREYMPSEIISSFGELGLKYLETKYFHYTFPKSVGQRVVTFIGAIMPRFRQGMMLIAAKN